MLAFPLFAFLHRPTHATRPLDFLRELLLRLQTDTDQSFTTATVLPPRHLVFRIMSTRPLHFFFGSLGLARSDLPGEVLCCSGLQMDR
jgi:hypothetical protein